MLRDRIVCGVNNARIQNRVLPEATLIYQRALELAQNLEIAAQILKELQKCRWPSTCTAGGCRQAAGGYKGVSRRTQICLFRETNLFQIAGWVPEPQGILLQCVGWNKITPVMQCLPL